MNDFDPLTRAVRCEKCGEWWHQGTWHRCKPVNQLDEAIRDRDRRIAELEVQINNAGDTDIDWYRQELSKSAVTLKSLRDRIAELEARITELESGIDTGDIVFHVPTGEEWTVAYVKGDRLAWLGWPPGEANLSDCMLVEKASDEKMMACLYDMTKSTSDRLSAYARRRLDRMVS